VRANDFKEVEIIVISDEINSATFQVVAELLSDRDTFIKRTGPNGPAASRNMGLLSAKGQRVIFLDDDDALLPGYLTEAKAWCDKYPEKVLYVNYRVIEEDRKNNGSPTRTTDLAVGDQP
jgi:glycosyltransferase involved in cell wall biosynthesis